VIILVPFLTVAVLSVWAFTSWSKDCHAGPTSEVIGWPYFVLGLTFVIPALVSRQRGKSVWMSVGQGVLSAVVTVVLSFVMYIAYLGVYSVDMGACLG
jgi:hypothetical protein